MGNPGIWNLHWVNKILNWQLIKFQWHLYTLMVILVLVLVDKWFCLNEKHVFKICRWDSAVQEILAIVHKYVQPSCGAYLHAINRDSYIQIGINLCLCDVFNIDYLIQIWVWIRLYYSSLYLELLQLMAIVGDCLLAHLVTTWADKRETVEKGENWAAGNTRKGLQARETYEDEI